MIRYKPADVVIVHFPFTDNASTKKRPAIVLSSEKFNESNLSLVLLALTSRDQNDESLRINEWSLAGLIKPTWIKPIIFTIALQLIEKKLGHLAEKDIHVTGLLLNALLSDLFIER